MSFEIYHQLGHNYNWNLQSFKDDSCGNGMIISPCHTEEEKCPTILKSVSGKAFFDPQFFVPNSTKGKLKTYSFFPQVVSGGFATQDYAADSKISARECVSFQLSSDFEYGVIPTRYLAGTPSDFIKGQSEYFVEPFLREFEAQGCSKKLLLQLVLNEHMLKDEDFLSDILNWATGLTEIEGIYLITELQTASKQVNNLDFLIRKLHLIEQLRANDLMVVLGYLNTESLLLAIAGPDVLTIGSYENVRLFGATKFVDEKKETRGPTPRLYISQLTQLVDHRYLNVISRLFSDDFFDDTPYNAELFEPSFKWHFSKPALYKHYFVVLCRQLDELKNLDGNQRYSQLCDILGLSLDNFQIINSSGIVLDDNSGGTHLPIWLTAAHQFARDMGWRS